MNSIALILSVTSFLIPIVLPLGVWLFYRLGRTKFVRKHLPSLSVKYRGGFFPDVREVVYTIWSLWACIAIGLILAAASLIFQPDLISFGFGALVFNLLLTIAVMIDFLRPSFSLAAPMPRRSTVQTHEAAPKPYFSYGSWVGYGAALWAFVFGVFHIIWARGWYVGLDPESARIAFAKTSFLIYDIVVAGICLFAVPVALALVMPWGRRLPRWLLGFFAWTGTGLLVIRSLASIVQGGYLFATGQFPVEIGIIWELWFYLGAILFSVSTWRYWSRSA